MSTKDDLQNRLFELQILKGQGKNVDRDIRKTEAQLKRAIDEKIDEDAKDTSK